MQIVIDIDESTYNYIMKYHNVGGWVANTVTNAILGGILLPKEHNRLIDEKEIDIVVNGFFSIFDTYSSETFLNVIHNQCIETIGADKAKSEASDADSN